MWTHLGVFGRMYKRMFVVDAVIRNERRMVGCGSQQYLGLCSGRCYSSF
jgi:hypothetical protein